MSYDLGSSPRQLSLSPFDYVFFGKGRHPITIAYYFEQRQDFTKLRESLSRALAQFWPLKGSLVRSDDGGVHIVENLDNPYGLASFEERRVETMPDLDDHQAILEFVETVDFEMGKALLKLRLIQFPVGSLLSASMSHGAADGFGYFFFLMTWAAMTRGDDLPPPNHDRSPLERGMDGEDYATDESIFNATQYFALPIERFQAHVERVEYDDLFLSNAFVTEELRKAREVAGADLSRNDVVTAWLWKKYAEAWHHSGESISVSCAFDFRRLIEEITPMYFGNAACAAIAELPFERVLGSPLGEIASVIRASVTRIDRPAIERLLRCTATLRARGWFTEGAPKSLRGWHPDSTLLVTNLSRVPLGQLDFGTGSPKRLYPIGGGRAAVVFAAEGGLRVLVGLRPGDHRTPGTRT